MEISKHITKKTIIYICIIIIIIIILRILYSNLYSNTEGFEINTSAADDLLSKLKSTYAQEIVDPNNINLEMQIYSWSNKLHNMLYPSQQSKPIAFYKPNLIINRIEYSKLGDIISQNIDYSLPKVDQFTLLVKKNTSDIKSPMRFDLITEIDFPNFDNNYYNFSNYISNTININVIKDSIVNCTSALNNLNTIIQNNLSLVQNNFTNKVYNDSNINIDNNLINIQKLITKNVEFIEEFETTVDTGYVDFIPSPLVNIDYKGSTPKFNISASNDNKYEKIININSSLSLPAGSIGNITVSSLLKGIQNTNFNIPSKLDSEQDGNAQNIVNKLSKKLFSNLTTSNITFNTISSKLFSYIPIENILNYLISLCNDIGNIYNNQSQTKSQSTSNNLLLYLKLAPNIGVVQSIIKIISSNSDNINSLTLDTIFTQISGLNLNINNVTDNTSLLEIVLYIINNMMITYKLTYINFSPSDIENVSSAYNDTLKYMKTFADPPLIADPTYVGCYKDSGDRALPNRLNNVSTVGQCAQQAQNKGYGLIGVQYGGECYGGNDSNKATKYGEAKSDCGVLGGYWVNQVYKVQATPPITLFINNVKNDIISNIPTKTYNITTNSSFTKPIIRIINSTILKLTSFSQFILDMSENKIDYFPLQIYNPVPPDNYISLGHIFCNTKTDLQKIIASNNIACIPSHCVKEMREWTSNDKIYELNKNDKYFAIYFNPYTGTFISTNKKQLPLGKVCKVVACVKKCNVVEDLQKSDDCSRKYYNLNKNSIANTPLISDLASNQEEEFYLDKIKAQSDSITRLKQRAQKMQIDIDKATIVNREMNKNKLQNYVDTQKQNIDIIMERLQADKNKIQTNVNIPNDTLNAIIDMIQKSSMLSSSDKELLLTQIENSQSLSNSKYNANMNKILSSCPEYDLSGLVSKKTASDVCYGCDAPK